MGPKKLRPLTHYIVPALFVGALFLMQIFGSPEESDILHIQGEAMGTTWSLKIAQSPLVKSDIVRGLQAEIEKVNLEMSTYIDFSTVSRFNQHTDLQTGLPISDNLKQVLETARYVHDQSFGAFDVTVGPLVRAWGFGANKASEPPTPDEVTQVLSKLGMSHIYIKDLKLYKVVPETEIDLSAIAKGYAVDIGGEWLENQGVINYLLEIGGEIRSRGMKSEDKAWTVGIESPSTDGTGAVEAITLRNTSMATSGDYRQFYELDGKRISHTIDPRDGQPVSHGLASVSVIHESTMLADAWATAIGVLGPKEGLIMANRHQLGVRMIVREDNGQFSAQESQTFTEKTR